MISDRGVAWVIYVVLAIWSAGMVVSMWPGSTYQMDPLVHGIFTATVVSSLTYRMRRDAARTKDDDDTPGSHRR